MQLLKILRSDLFLFESVTDLILYYIRIFESSCEWTYDFRDMCLCVCMCVCVYVCFCWNLKCVTDFATDRNNDTWSRVDVG